jgi:hypothetical protein
MSNTTDDQAHDVDPLRAEREPDADFGGASSDFVRRESVESEAHQNQSGESSTPCSLQWQCLRACSRLDVPRAWIRWWRTARMLKGR